MQYVKKSFFNFLCEGDEDHGQCASRPSDSDVLCNLSPSDGGAGSSHTQQTHRGASRGPQRGVQRGHPECGEWSLLSRFERMSSPYLVSKYFDHKKGRKKSR